MGCAGAEPVPREEPQPDPSLAAQFDRHAAGTIEGRVAWTGAVPVVTPFVSSVRPLAELSMLPRLSWPNPNAPVIDTQSGSVVGAVVFLRGVEPARSRPWYHPPVLVEQRAYQYLVRQGAEKGRIGFVRRGEPVEMLSVDAGTYSLQARGAAFFTLTFVTPHQPTSRRPGKNGLIELGSGGGHFWMRAYLFVDDHPYYA